MRLYEVFKTHTQTQQTVATGTTVRVGRVTFKKKSPTVKNYLLKIVVINVISVPQREGLYYIR